MWGTIAIVLIVLWLLGALTFKAAGALIHLLLLLALIAVIVHFVGRARTR